MGFAQLLREAPLGRLHELIACGCSLSDRAMELLAASALDELLALDVSSNKLTDKGLRALAAWPGLKHVTHLRTGNNRKLTTAGHTPSSTWATLWTTRPRPRCASASATHCGWADVPPTG